MNLVDVDKLKELIADPDDSARYGYLSMFDLEDAEIIETQPVRHGKWKEEVAHKEWAGLLPNAWEEEATIHNGNTSDYWCSECHSKGLHHWGYCCVCGAKIDKE